MNMNININIRQKNTYSPAFGTKYFKSDALLDIAKYSVEKGKFDKLNKARKNISRYDLQTRLLVDLCYTECKPTVIFSRYVPSKDTPVALSEKDYDFVKQVEIISNKSQNILKFALGTLIRLGNGAPNNKLYKKVVKD